MSSLPTNSGCPRKNCDHIQKPVDDRTLVQTDKAALPAEVLLGREPQCYQDADILRTDGPAADGGDQEKVVDEEVFRQHDHRDQTAPDELCEPYGVHKGHLQGVAIEV